MLFYHVLRSESCHFLEKKQKQKKNTPKTKRKNSHTRSTASSENFPAAVFILHHSVFIKYHQSSRLATKVSPFQVKCEMKNVAASLLSVPSIPIVKMKQIIYQ